jgi:uncharacterized membrane protein
MGKYAIFAAFMLLIVIWNALWLGAPFLAMGGNTSISNILYPSFKPFCHQLPQRSLCAIQAPNGALSLGDCISASTSQISRFVFADERGTGYQFAVCARDFAIYLMMMVGGIAYFLTHRKNIDQDTTPPMWILVIALIPIALDGGTQYIGLRESTNFLRLVTGAITGFIVPFYAIPLLYYFVPVMKRAFFGGKNQ